MQTLLPNPIVMNALTPAFKLLRAPLTGAPATDAQLEIILDIAEAYVVVGRTDDLLAIVASYDGTETFDEFACRLLYGIFERLPNALYFMNSPHIRRIADIVRSLGVDTAGPVVIEALGKNQDRIQPRRSGMRAGRNTAQRRSRPLCDALLGAESQKVREAAALSLGSIGDPVALPALATAKHERPRFQGPG